MVSYTKINFKWGLWSDILSSDDSKYDFLAVFLKKPYFEMARYIPYEAIFDFAISQKGLDEKFKFLVF